MKRSLLDEVKNLLNKLLSKYENQDILDEAQKWLKKNIYRVRLLFENYTVRDFIAEPFKSVFDSSTNTLNTDIYSIITQVAVINAVLAGLPGKMGIGVTVSIALEFWMAYRIAQHVGLNINGISDIRKYFGVLAATLATIVWGVKAALGLAFSFFSLISGPINPLIFAELLITDLLGVAFWFGFSNVKKNKKFEAFGAKDLVSVTKELFLHQYRILKNLTTPYNIKLTATRLTKYLKGDFPVDQRLINGEVFSTVAMAYLLSAQYEKLTGPLGETFIRAIRLRWSSQFNESTSIEEIAERFSEYNPEQIDGVINTIKGKMFEIMVADDESIFGDGWSATMYTDESFPGSDIIFSNLENGNRVEISLKAIGEENSQIIENALIKYPDIPIMTTEEVANLYKDDPRIFGSGIFHEDLESITEEKFEELIETIKPINHNEVIIGGITFGASAALWPFVMAYLRKKITYNQLERVFNHVLGETGLKLVSRISYGVVLGPLFAWWLLARGVKGLVTMVEPKNTTLIEYSKLDN